MDQGMNDSVVIADNVVVGENCVLTSCAIDSNVRVGNNSTLMDGAKMERESMLADNSTLATARVIPSGQLWAGSPATYVRDLTSEEIEELRTAPTQKYDESRSHKALFE